MAEPDFAPVAAPGPQSTQPTQPTTPASAGGVAAQMSIAQEPLAPAFTAAPTGGAKLWPWVAGAAVLFALAAGALAWNTQQRLKLVEGQLVKRQQESAVDAAQAHALARSADNLVRESAAKLALLEAKVAEAVMVRSQFEDLIQSLARSRDENVLADVDAALRVATQQSALTGSLEPLVQVLKQSEERLARLNQPRLERVRRALAQDLEQVRASAAVDLPSLAIRLDDAIRQVDELPLLANPSPLSPASTTIPRGRELAHEGSGPASPSGSPAAAAGLKTSQPAPEPMAWWQPMVSHVWEEAKGLLRVTRIDRPEAALLAPEQAYFLKENLKLRLLNARLALMARQVEVAQADLREAGRSIERYFDGRSKRSVQLLATVQQVQAQARTLVVPRPDASLAAVAAVAATASAGAGR